MVDDNNTSKEIVVLKNGADFGIFDEISSKQLCELSKPIEIMLAVGKKDTLIRDFELPAPTDDDIKWAIYQKSKSASRRVKLLEKAIEQNRLWRIVYMCKTYVEKDNDKGWFNPNETFSWVKSRSLLSSSCKSGTVEGVALLLQCRGINVNLRFSIGEMSYGNALDSLLNRTDHESTISILKMIIACDLKASSIDIEKGKTTAIRELLRSVGRKTTEYKNVKVKELPAPDIIEDGVVWKKLDSDSIYKLTSNEDFRLRKVFNFLSSTVSECNEYLDENNNVTTATQPIVTPMSRVSCKKEIEQAQKRLKKLNGV